MQSEKIALTEMFNFIHFASYTSNSWRQTIRYIDRAVPKTTAMQSLQV